MPAKTLKISWLLLIKPKLSDFVEVFGREYTHWSRVINCCTGWKKLHGVKFQTISLPNGMLFYVFGPVSCRRGDRYTLSQSGIEDNLREMMRGGEAFHVYGDSAYSRGEQITAHIEKSILTAREKEENRCFNACRESVEWGNKEIKNFFKASVFDQGLRLLSMDVSEMLKCCILFTNCLCAMYGNQTSEYFDYNSDILDSWTSLGPRRMQE